MNEKIKELIKKADRRCSETRGVYDEILAELVVQECVKECQQEWYDLNNAPDETEARAIAIRVGQKNGLLKAMSRIKQHFGIKE